MIPRNDYRALTTVFQVPRETVESCMLISFSDEDISSIRINKNTLDYSTKILRLDNKKWKINIRPDPKGNNFTGKMDIFLNELSYPLQLTLIAKKEQ